jgi:hypothetical protein
VLAPGGGLPVYARGRKQVVAADGTGAIGRRCCQERLQGVPRFGYGIAASECALSGFGPNEPELSPSSNPAHIDDAAIALPDGNLETGIST